MTRTLATAVDSYLTEPTIDFRTLAHITFTSTTMRLHSGMERYLWVGSTYYDGIGAGGYAEKISEDAGEFTNGVRLHLSAVNSSALSEAVTESLFGKEVFLYRCFLRDGVVVNTAELWYRGQMAETNIVRGDPERGNYIEVNCETKLNRRSKVSFFTREDLITAGYSGDTFFDLLHHIPNVKALWGSKAIPVGGPLPFPKPTKPPRNDP